MSTSSSRKVSSARGGSGNTTDVSSAVKRHPKSRRDRGNSSNARRISESRDTSDRQRSRAGRWRDRVVTFCTSGSKSAREFGSHPVKSGNQPRDDGFVRRSELSLAQTNDARRGDRFYDPGEWSLVCGDGHRVDKDMSWCGGVTRESDDDDDALFWEDDAVMKSSAIGLRSRWPFLGYDDRVDWSVFAPEFFRDDSPLSVKSDDDDEDFVSMPVCEYQKLTHVTDSRDSCNSSDFRDARNSHDSRAQEASDAGCWSTPNDGSDEEMAELKKMLSSLKTQRLVAERDNEQPENSPTAGVTSKQNNCDAIRNSSNYENINKAKNNIKNYSNTNDIDDDDGAFECKDSTTRNNRYSINNKNHSDENNNSNDSRNSNNSNKYNNSTRANSNNSSCYLSPPPTMRERERASSPPQRDSNIVTLSSASSTVKFKYSDDYEQKMLKTIDDMLFDEKMKSDFMSPLRKITTRDESDQPILLDMSAVLVDGDKKLPDVEPEKELEMGDASQVVRTTAYSHVIGSVARRCSAVGLVVEKNVVDVAERRNMAVEDNLLLEEIDRELRDIPSFMRELYKC